MTANGVASSPAAKPVDFDTYVCPACKTQNFQASKLGPWHAHVYRCACGWTGHGRGLVKAEK